jgi:hypothetical protein
LGVALMAGGLLIGASSAAMAYGSLGAGYYHALGGGSSIWLGNFIIDGNYVYCAGQTGAADPLAQGSYSGTSWYDGAAGDSWTGSWHWPSPPTIGVPGGGWNPLRQEGASLNQANTSGHTQTGITLAGANLDQMGYVLARYGQTADNTQAARMRMLEMEKFQVLVSSVATQRLEPLTSSALGNRNWIDSVWNEAIAYAGPYDTSALDTTVNADQKTGTLSGIGMYSAAGNLYPGATWTATITTGNAVWNSNNAAVTSGTTGASLESAGFHVTPTGTGFVQIVVNYTNVPDWRVGIQTSGSAQAVMHGRMTSQSETAMSRIPVANVFSVGIATTTSEATARPGDALTDQLTVAIPPLGGVWGLGYIMTVTSTLYGPFATAPAQSATVPVGAPVAGTVTTDVPGEGTYTSPPITVTAPGFYAWSESAPATPLVFTGWQSDFGRPSEQTNVQKWAPSATTTVSSATTTPGATVTDTATLTGGQPGGTTTVTFTLYHDPTTTAPVEGAPIPGGATVEATVTKSVTFDSSGNATVSADLVVPATAAPGYATIVLSIEGTTTMTAWTSNYGITNETTLQKWDPAGTTTVSSATITPGATVTDTATLTGGQPGGTTTVTFDLYHDPSTVPPVEGAAIPAGATVEATVTKSVTFDSSGNATVAADLIVPATEGPGYLTVVVSIEGTATMNAWTSHYGITNETTLVPWVDDVVTVAARAAGNVFTDTVTITGFPSDYGAMADEGAPITVSLFFVDRAFTGDISTQCIAGNLLASTTVPGGNGTVVANDPKFDLADYATPAMDGYYLFQVSYPGTTRVAGFTAPCGQAPETMFLVLTAFNGDDLAMTGPEHVQAAVLIGSLLALLGAGLIAGSRWQLMPSSACPSHNRGRARHAKRRTLAQ